ncbi:hypothetical protein CYMTET_29364 [Cymbomonas tetramitiformis]|uniref:SAM domain-containing protein n=1 Tax=Cymbomonas tetramitiformis TaxID=36881 RepID=A0AAE0KV02_9CHLO|nr:hypothetical protein CYMTET_29364 [Cymbomonas tetramitiformis]
MKTFCSAVIMLAPAMAADLMESGKLVLTTFRDASCESDKHATNTITLNECTEAESSSMYTITTCDRSTFQFNRYLDSACTELLAPYNGQVGVCFKVGVDADTGNDLYGIPECEEESEDGYSTLEIVGVVMGLLGAMCFLCLCFGALKVWLKKSEAKRRERDFGVEGGEEWTPSSRPADVYASPAGAAGGKFPAAPPVGPQSIAMQRSAVSIQEAASSHGSFKSYDNPLSQSDLFVAPAPPTNLDLRREQLMAFFEQHDPLRVDDVERMLEHSTPGEISIELQREYGSDPFSEVKHEAGSSRAHNEVPTDVKLHLQAVTTDLRAKFMQQMEPSAQAPQLTPGPARAPPGSEGDDDSSGASSVLSEEENQDSSAPVPAPAVSPVPAVGTTPDSTAPRRAIQRELSFSEYNSDDVIELLESLNIPSGVVKMRGITGESMSEMTMDDMIMRLEISKADVARLYTALRTEFPQYY